MNYLYLIIGTVLLFTGMLLGFELLFIGTHSWIYDGFRHAIPWWVAWFIIHGGTFAGMILMAKGIIG